VLKRILLWGLLLSGLASWSVARADDCIPGELLVELKPGVNIAAFNQTYGTQTIGSSLYANSYRLFAGTYANLPALLSRMANDARVIFADENLRNRALDAPTDGSTPPSVQWVSTFTGDDGPTAYKGQPAIPNVGYGATAKKFSGAGVMVAILDTGISRRHPLLAHQVALGWNFVDNSADSDDRPNGKNSIAVGHGTMVAGLVYRFAPKATLLPVKVLDSNGTGHLWSTLEGIRYAIARGARVLNLSFGSAQNSQLLHNTIRQAWSMGVLVVASAGNGNTNVPQYPAGYPEALTVASLNNNNTKASFSNYGSFVDVSAPGVFIISTYWDGRYAAWSGTSFSAPMVSGAAALLLSAKPLWHADHIINQLKHSAGSIDWYNPKYEDMLGAGKIDIDAALSKISIDRVQVENIIENLGLGGMSSDPRGFVGDSLGGFGSGDLGDFGSGDLGGSSGD
jgi:subtilisin family serine protease